MICRICFDDNNQHDIISPCDCDGTSKWVHRTCLDTWRNIKQIDVCDVCHMEYDYHNNVEKNSKLYIEREIEKNFQQERKKRIERTEDLRSLFISFEEYHKIKQETDNARSSKLNKFK